MNTVERSPSPLMFTKQHSDGEPSPSSALAVPSATTSLPSPQMKRKLVSEGKKYHADIIIFMCILYTVVCAKFCKFNF